MENSSQIVKETRRFHPKPYPSTYTANPITPYHNPISMAPQSAPNAL